MSLDPFDYRSLAKQITIQKKINPKLDPDIDWSQPIDMSKTFLPLTDLEELFPDASMEQYIALSQWLGLVVNHTMSELEETLHELKQLAWQSVLEEFPVSSEMNELGEMFFALRAKHSRDFSQYQSVFCQTQGIDQDILDSLMPKCYGAFFKSTITSNAIAGGPMLWWVIAEVEEASVDVCQNILDNWDLVDPLFCDIHRKHIKENARHENYAHLMLSLLSQRPQGLQRIVEKKIDFMLTQILSAPSVLHELNKFLKIKDFADHHSFFSILASCLPLYQKLSYAQKLKYTFNMGPYISGILNPKWKNRSNRFADRLGGLRAPGLKFLEDSI